MSIGQLALVLGQERVSSEFHIHETIRLNALKFHGSWWAINKIEHFKMSDLDVLVGTGKAIPLTFQHFRKFPNFDMKTGRDMDSLLYDPHQVENDGLKVAWHNHEKSAICTQQVFHQMGKKSHTTYVAILHFCCLRPDLSKI